MWKTNFDTAFSGSPQHLPPSSPHSAPASTRSPRHQHHHNPNSFPDEAGSIPHARSAHSHSLHANGHAPGVLPKPGSLLLHVLLLIFIFSNYRSFLYFFFMANKPFVFVLELLMLETFHASSWRQIGLPLGHCQCTPRHGRSAARGRVRRSCSIWR